jgi:adenylate kinase
MPIEKRDCHESQSEDTIGDDELAKRHDPPDSRLDVGPYAPRDGATPAGPGRDGVATLTYVATGELLRSRRSCRTPLGRRAARYMAAGRLVPDELVIAMVLDEIGGDEDRGFLLDGFPRTLGQADALDLELTARARELTAAVLLEVPEDALLERIIGRRQCPRGHVYHVRFNPPARAGACDHDGERLLQREDDRETTVRERLRVYQQATEPLIGYYAERGLLRRVDGTRSPDTVQEALLAGGRPLPLLRRRDPRARGRDL